MKKVYNVDVTARKNIMGLFVMDSFGTIWVHRYDGDGKLYGKQYEIKSAKMLERARRMQDAILGVSNEK